MVDTSGGVGAGVAAPAPSQQFHQGFERLESKIRAVPEEELIPINLEMPRVVATVLGALPEMVKLRGALSELTGFDLAAFDALEDLALALGHTHTLFRIESETQDSLPELVAEAMAAREQLQADVAALVKRKLIDPSRMPELRGGNGHSNVAFDLVSLVELMLAHWPTVQGKTAVEMAELERARSVASRIVALVGRREQAEQELGPANMLRRQAFTLLMRAYDEAQRGVGFLRWHHGDADRIVPSLYPGRPRRSRSSDEADEVDALPQPVGTSHSESANASAAVGNASAATAVAANAPVGFPGASPLTRG
jgi:hypothetical protein